MKNGTLKSANLIIDTEKKRLLYCSIKKGDFITPSLKQLIQKASCDFEKNYSVMLYLGTTTLYLPIPAIELWNLTEAESGAINHISKETKLNVYIAGSNLPKLRLLKALVSHYRQTANSSNPFFENLERLIKICCTCGNMKKEELIIDLIGIACLKSICVHSAYGLYSITFGNEEGLKLRQLLPKCS